MATGRNSTTCLSAVNVCCAARRSVALSGLFVFLLLCQVVMMPAALAAVPDPAPRQLLSQMVTALHQADYSGNFVYLYGTQMSTMRVTHAVRNGEEFERITHLDGERAEVIRTGNQVICIHPDQSMTRLDRALSSGPFARHEQLADTLPAHYRIVLDGEDRVADRMATRLRLDAMDSHRFGYRLWIDQATSLLLKSELVDGQGHVLEKIEFVSLSIDPALPDDFFNIPKQAMADPAVIESVPRAGAVPELKPGWLPAGFLPTTHDLRRVSATDNPVDAYSFSDGLAAFTLFVEAAGEGQQGMTQTGPTVALSREVALAGNTVLVTLVGEIPPATAERILSSLSP